MWLQRLLLQVLRPLLLEQQLQVLLRVPLQQEQHLGQVLLQQR